MTDVTSESNSCQSYQSPGPKQKCANCKVSYYCNRDCQKNNWPLHKTLCTFYQNHPPSDTAEPKSMACVKMHGGAIHYSATTIPSTHHPIFHNRALPITLKFNFPLVIHRMVEGLPQDRSTNNQHAIWLNIDTTTGFAPHNRCGCIGDVIVAKADGTPLSVEVLGDYVSNILDAFGDGKGAPTQMYDRARLFHFLISGLMCRRCAMWLARHWM